MEGMRAMGLKIQEQEKERKAGKEKEKVEISTYPNCLLCM